ncbi:hypothetical protein LTR94_007384 [Friedmanniomyces endolithicus]|nr:hypothetical protein LTR94_007384 [Friedmanniomyces endolithicus]
MVVSISRARDRFGASAELTGSGRSGSERTQSPALEALLDVTIDPQKRAPLSEQLDAAVRERDICRARFNQIDRGGPFKAPPEGEEARLLEAIRIVSQRLANTQQWERLLTAIDGLVQAYAGKKTEPAAAADA